MKLELCFQVLGQNLPVDHGYALYSSLCKIVPSFHEDKDSLVSSIKGRYSGNGMLNISPYSEILMRVPEEQVREYTAFAGSRLCMRKDKINIGVYKPRLIQAIPNLWAKIVTTKNGENIERFRKEVIRQLTNIAIDPSKMTIGKRKVFQLRRKCIVGFEVYLNNLSHKESITLQENGLGGRKKMGCGFFEGYST